MEDGELVHLLCWVIEKRHPDLGFHGICPAIFMSRGTVGLPLSKVTPISPLWGFILRLSLISGCTSRCLFQRSRGVMSPLSFILCRTNTGKFLELAMIVACDLYI